MRHVRRVGKYEGSPRPIPAADQPDVTSLRSCIQPGMRVRHPERPDWGIGQVQSVVGDRVTVNFENAGKLLINTGVVSLDVEDDGPR